MFPPGFLSGCHRAPQRWQGGHMLILTRRPGEALIIETPASEQITVTVL